MPTTTVTVNAETNTATVNVNAGIQYGEDAALLGSGTAADGYVLAADGAGGAAWEAASGGTWDGLTGKPSTFPPSAHDHSGDTLLPAVVKAPTSAGLALQSSSGTELARFGAGGSTWTFAAGLGVAFNSTSYSFGTGAASAFKTALAVASADITDATSDILNTLTPADEKLMKVTDITTGTTWPQNISISGMSRGPSNGTYRMQTFGRLGAIYTNSTSTLTVTGSYSSSTWSATIYASGGVNGYTSSVVSETGFSISSVTTFATWTPQGTATGTPVFALPTGSTTKNRRVLGVQVPMVSNSLRKIFFATTPRPDGRPDMSSMIYDAPDVALDAADYFGKHSETTGLLARISWSDMRSAVWTWIQTQFVAGRNLLLTGTQAQARAEIGSGAVGDTLFTAGTQAAARTALGEVWAVKTASTTRASTTTLAADPDLQITLTSGRWAIQIVTTSNNPTGGGWRHRLYGPTLTESGTTVMLGSGIAGVTPLDVRAATSTQTQTFTATDGRTGCIVENLVWRTSTTGTFGVEWAQNTSNIVENIITGGYIRAIRISD